MKTITERFMEFVSPEPNTGCWLWVGAECADGYGGFHDGHTRRAHRVAYELFRGPIPKGLELDHLCRVRCCVNPQHLEPVTRRENMRRSPLKGRNQQVEKTHCPAGHPYDEANTYRYRTSRACKICRQHAKIRYRRLGYR